MHEACILYTLYAYIILIVIRMSESSFKVHVAHMSSIRCDLSAFYLLTVPTGTGGLLGHVLILFEFFILFCVGLAAGYRNVFTKNAQT